MTSISSLLILNARLLQKVAFTRYCVDKSGHPKKSTFFFLINPQQIHNKSIHVSWVLALLPQVGECLYVCVDWSPLPPRPYSTNFVAYEAYMYIYTSKALPMSLPLGCCCLISLLHCLFPFSSFLSV